MTQPSPFQGSEFQDWLAGRIDERRLEDESDLASLTKYADLSAVKVTGYLQVTDEQLMDAGLLPDTRAKWKPTWRYRLSSWWWNRRTDLGEIIAGRRFEE